MQHVGDAIAAFERSLLSGNSRFDRWYFAGNKKELTAEEIAGFELFSGKAKCTSCHTIDEKSALFTDQEFHVTGVGYFTATAPAPKDLKVTLAPGVHETVQTKLLDAFSGPVRADTGRFEVTLQSKDRWAYKTPSLRNVEYTFPYMHNGSLKTLDDVIEFYDQGGYPHDGVREVHPLGLTAAQKQSLVAFLKTLTGDNVNVPLLPTE
jgi:cytochrome c peroxidase